MTKKKRKKLILVVVNEASEDSSENLESNLTIRSNKKTKQSQLATTSHLLSFQQDNELEEGEKLLLKALSQ